MSPTLRSPDGDLYFLREIHGQTGGGDHIYTHVYEDREYWVKIRDIEITDDQDLSRGEIYLMSPIDDRISRRCVFAKILRDNPTTVELMDLILEYNCTDQPETPPKIGRVYVHMMTQFIIDNHERLGVNRIELTDNAHYRCPQNRRISIYLERSRQLEGEDPYYIQFGYVPKSTKSSRKLHRNRLIMSQILTKHDGV